MEVVKKMKNKIHIRYKNSKGNYIPGVTTVIGLLGKPALIHWAWKLGKDGIDYRRERDGAASIGTLAHYLIECDIKGVEPDTTEYSKTQIDKAENAFLNWLSWKDTFGKFRVVGSEIQLTDEEHGYGGTSDLIVKKDNEYILIDFKTSKAIYPEMTYQLAAYRNLWNINNPDKQIMKCYILRISKEGENFESKAFGNLSDEYNLFLHLLEVYKIREKIKRR